jgi:crossover junction endodeoxyribonuclease RuvC
VDPGTRRVGYGIIDMPTSARFEYVECGVIKAPRGSDLPSRIHLIARTLNEVIVEFSPTVLAIEKAFHGINGASALRLGEARGAIMHVGVDQGLAVFEYAPAHVKRAVAGHGRAAKADIQQRVAVLCGLRRLPALDAADALAIALCHGQHAVESGAASQQAGKRGTMP